MMRNYIKTVLKKKTIGFVLERSNKYKMNLVTSIHANIDAIKPLAINTAVLSERAIGFLPQSIRQRHLHQ